MKLQVNAGHVDLIGRSSAELTAVEAVAYAMVKASNGALVLASGDENSVTLAYKRKVMKVAEVREIYNDAKKEHAV